MAIRVLSGGQVLKGRLAVFGIPAASQVLRSIHIGSYAEHDTDKDSALIPMPTLVVGRGEWNAVMLYDQSYSIL